MQTSALTELVKNLTRSLLIGSLAGFPSTCTVFFLLNTVNHRDLLMTNTNVPRRVSEETNRFITFSGSSETRVKSDS